MTNRGIEDEVEALVVEVYEAVYGKPPGKWLKAILLRVGTTGVVATLEEAGNAIGVTRERVRQVMAALAPRLKGRTTPTLREVAKALAERSPVPEPIGKQLAPSGLARTTLTGDAFLNFLKLLGTSPTELVGTDLVVVGDWLVEESEAPVMDSIAVAARHTSSYGMTTVEEIRQALATPENSLDAADIESVLKRGPNVKWAGEWLWVEKTNDSLYANRLINTARAILSVNSPQTVTSIYEGARRLWKFRKLDILPPIAAMTSFFNQTSYFVVQGDLVRPTEPLNYHEILGPTTATMIDVLKSSSYQVMDRQSLHEACADAGIASSTCGIWITYAEWMERFGPNVWGLRGSSPNPAAVEAIRQAARARSKAEPHRKNWSWTPDGKISQTMDVTTSFLGSGVLSFVPEIQSVLAGQSLTVVLDGKQVATAKLGNDHSFCWGWHPAIAAMGAKPGNVLRITVHIAEKTADVQIGGQELWV